MAPEFNSVVKTKHQQRVVTSAVFLDVEKAFDQVWHASLLHKMKNFVMDQNLLRWINNFWCERSISINIKDIKSSVFTPKHRVPQRSPLSPILFITYVRNISQPGNLQTTTLSQFTDDIALWAYGRNTVVSQYKIQKHLDKIMK